MSYHLCINFFSTIFAKACKVVYLTPASSSPYSKPDEPASISMAESGGFLLRTHNRYWNRRGIGKDESNVLELPPLPEIFCYW